MSVIEYVYDRLMVTDALSSNALTSSMKERLFLKLSLTLYIDLLAEMSRNGLNLSCPERKNPVMSKT